jgi:hypothetical protein
MEYGCLKSGATTEAELKSEVRLKQLMSSDIQFGVKIMKYANRQKTDR